MIRMLKSFSLCVISGLLIGCTHYYYPMNESAVLQGRSQLSEYNLESTEIDLRCSWRSINGDKQADPNLCSYLSKLLSQENAEVNSASDESNGQTRIDLLIFVDGMAMAAQSSKLDQALMWISLGLYPAVTDRWQAIDVRIYDARNRLLEKGSFKALFRTYYGWGYWVGDRTMSLLRSNPPHRYKEPNSQDFYHFVSQLIYNAHMSRKGQSNAIEQEE